jgi:hypothetical protein
MEHEWERRRKGKTLKEKQTNSESLLFFVFGSGISSDVTNMSRGQHNGSPRPYSRLSEPELNELWSKI